MMDWVLVTGASGLWSHVFDTLIKGTAYRVRGTVRSQAKADAITALYPEHHDRIDLVIVKDLAENRAFDAAVKGVTYVIHVASPIELGFSDNKDMLDPAVNGTRELIQAAATQPSIKRVVITSSIAAVVDLGKGFRPGYTYTPDDWCPVGWDEAQKTDAKLQVYCASKKYAELAAWDYVNSHGAAYDIIVFCPPMIYGPTVGPINLDSLNLSTKNAKLGILDSETIPAQHSLGWLIDARDCAQLHVLALDGAKVKGNERFIVSSGRFTWAQVAQIVQTRFPAVTVARIPSDYNTQPYFSLDKSKADGVFNLKYRSVEQTMYDMFAQIVE